VRPHVPASLGADWMDRVFSYRTCTVHNRIHDGEDLILEGRVTWESGDQLAKRDARDVPLSMDRHSEV